MLCRNTLLFPFLFRVQQLYSVWLLASNSHCYEATYTSNLSKHNWFTSCLKLNKQLFVEVRLSGMYPACTGIQLHLSNMAEDKGFLEIGLCWW